MTVDQAFDRMTVDQTFDRMTFGPAWTGGADGVGLHGTREGGEQHPPVRDGCPLASEPGAELIRRIIEFN